MAADNTFTVGKASGLYASVADAVADINAGTAPTATNRYSIKVLPGKYTSTSSVTIPQYVGVIGDSKGLVQFQNDTTDLFVCSGNNFFENFLIEGSATTSIAAFNGNNTNGIHIRNVDMLDNGGTSKQRFLKQSGSTWKTIFLENIVINSYATSGAYYMIQLTNSSGAARLVDVEIQNLFSDCYQLTSYGGTAQLQGCSDVRFRNCKIRGAASWNTGIRHEKNGVTGTPDIDIFTSFIQNASDSGVCLYGESGTNYNLINSYAKGATTSGTRTTPGSTV